MKKHSQRLLITTADERSWKKDRPVLFLGEWCRLYDRKEEWSAMDAIVAEPFGLGVDQKERDRQYINSLSQQLLEDLTISLNKFHQVNHDSRYWNILLGHWLQRFVSVSFNRYFSLEKVLRDYNVNETIVFNLPQYSLATLNSIDFIWALYDNVWNHVFYSRVLYFFKTVKAEILDINSDKLIGFRTFNDLKPENKFKSFLRDTLNKVLRMMSRENDAFIIKSYLPVTFSIKLHFLLGQIPVFWSSPKAEQSSLDIAARERLIIELKNHHGFELFIRQIISETIPTCFLEGYKNLIAQTRTLPWPSKPKFIFTSNNFDTDEIFKCWTAEKITEGVKYYVGQHGNNYGTWSYSLSFPEIITADKFISWGWKNSSSQVVPGFIFNTLGKRKSKKFSKGGLLLIGRCIHTRLTTFDNHFENIIYQNEQFRFYNSLHENIKSLVTVRLHLHPLSNMIWSDEQRWLDFNSSIRLEKGGSKIWKLINDNRLVVFSYDSTGILETLSLNIPVIAYWNGLLDEILPAAKTHYNTLINAGILFNTPEEASAHVSRHWNNIEEWWYSKEVQHARKSFCNIYARTVSHPASFLKKVFLDK